MRDAKSNTEIETNFYCFQETSSFLRKSETFDKLQLQLQLQNGVLGTFLFYLDLKVLIKVVTKVWFLFLNFCINTNLGGLFRDSFFLNYPFPPLCLKLIRIVLETWNWERKYTQTHIVSEKIKIYFLVPRPF